MMDGECSSEDWIGSDVGPPKGDIQSTIDWLELQIKFFFLNLCFVKDLLDKFIEFFILDC